MQNERDAAMVAAVRAGEPDAVAAIYQHFHGLVWSIAFRMMTDATVADDMAADTWCKLVRVLPTVAPDTTLAAFIGVAVRNRCLDELRRRQRMRWQPFEPEKHDQMSVSHHDRPEHDAIAAETVADVRAVLARMTRRHRAALLLVMHDDYGPADIGPALGLSRQASKSLAFRARHEFRRVAADLHLTGAA